MGWASESKANYRAPKKEKKKRRKRVSVESRSGFGEVGRLATGSFRSQRNAHTLHLTTRCPSAHLTGGRIIEISFRSRSLDVRTIRTGIFFYLFLCVCGNSTKCNSFDGVEHVRVLLKCQKYAGAHCMFPFTFSLTSANFLVISCVRCGDNPHLWRH